MMIVEVVSKFMVAEMSQSHGERAKLSPQTLQLSPKDYLCSSL